jgi:hypothetical protein
MFGALRGQHGAFPPPCGKATQRHMKKAESVLDHSFEASGATPGGCARAHPPERNATEKGRPPCKKVRQKPPSEY